MPLCCHNCALLSWGSRWIYNLAWMDAPVVPLLHPGELYEAFPQCRAHHHQGSHHKIFSVFLEVFVAEQVGKSFFSPFTNTVVIQGQKLSQGGGVQPVLLLQTQSIILWIFSVHLLGCKPYRLCKRLLESILFLLSTINLRKQQTVRGLPFMHRQGKYIPQITQNPLSRAPDTHSGTSLSLPFCPGLKPSHCCILIPQLLTLS